MYRENLIWSVVHKPWGLIVWSGVYRFERPVQELSVWCKLLELRCGGGRANNSNIFGSKLDMKWEGEIRWKKWKCMLTWPRRLIERPDMILYRWADGSAWLAVAIFTAVWNTYKYGGGERARNQESLPKARLKTSWFEFALFDFHEDMEAMLDEKKGECKLLRKEM